MIKVSVIIPVYNAEQYLEECCDSVFSQTLNEIEVICINDGSTDHSLDVLKKYEIMHDNMLLISTENRGVGNARNLGISLAKGKRCCFIDPDDRYPSNDVLEYLYHQSIVNGVEICGGSAILMMNGILDNNPSGAYEKYKFEKDMLIDFKDYQWSYGFWRFMYDTSFLKTNDIYFPQYIRYQDPPFMVKAMVCAKSFYAVKKATYIYRMSSKKIEYSVVKTRDYCKGMIDVLNISREEKLRELHINTLIHFDKWLMPHILKHIINGNPDLKTLVKIVKESVDTDMIDDKSLMDCFDVDNKLCEISKLKQKEIDFISQVNRFEYILVYGAGYVGKYVTDYLLAKIPSKKIIFAVTKANNDLSYHGIDIKNILEYEELDKDRVLILIATLDNLHEEIYRLLVYMKFKNIIKINFSEFLLYSSDEISDK